MRSYVGVGRAEAGASTEARVHCVVRSNTLWVMVTWESM